MRPAQSGLSLAKVLLLLAAIGLALGLVFRQEISRLYRIATLFEPGSISANMRSMNVHFDTAPVKAAGQPWELPQGDKIELPKQFDYDGQSLDTAEYLDYTYTASLMVLKDGQRRFEAYYRGDTAEDRHIAFSVSKSVTSALVGIAAAEGKIDIEKPAEFYVPEFKGSGYEGVSIKDILQMSSGVAFNEDYADQSSDINQVGRAMGTGGSVTEILAGLEREAEPGSRRLYISADTQVLSSVLRNATGQSMAEYMQTKLWQPMGAASDAYWLIDGDGVEMGFAGFNATLADLARFGLLYLNQGSRDGREIVPLAWWWDSLRTDAPHLKASGDPSNIDNWGYGYQWWIPHETDKHRGVFMAVGVYDQYIYIDPSRQLVITKLSGNPHYTDDNYDSIPKTLAMFRAIAESFD